MDDYIVAKTKEADFIGQLSFEEIARRFHARVLPGDYVATKSNGLSYQEIIQSGSATWVPVADLIWNQIHDDPPVSFEFAKQQLAKSLARVAPPLVLVSFRSLTLLLPNGLSWHIAVSLIVVFLIQAGILSLLQSPQAVKGFATCLRLIGTVLINFLLLATMTMILHTLQEASSFDTLVNELFYLFMWGLAVCFPTFVVAHRCAGIIPPSPVGAEKASARSGPWKKVALGCGVTLLLCSWVLTVNTVLTADPTDIDVHIEAPPQVVFHSHFTIVTRIKNTDMKSQTLVELDVADSYLHGVEIEQTEPKFTEKSHIPLARWVGYSFHQPINPGDELVVTLAVRAVHPGDFTGDIGFCINSTLRCLLIPIRTTVTDPHPGRT